MDTLKVVALSQWDTLKGRKKCYFFMCLSVFQSKWFSPLVRVKGLSTSSMATLIVYDCSSAKSIWKYISV